MNHTPEPWRGWESDAIVSGLNTTVCSESMAWSVADRDRAVACVNACAGINPEAVPDLLAACKEARELIHWLTDRLTHTTPDRVPVTVAKLVDAIAKAEANQ